MPYKKTYKKRVYKKRALTKNQKKEVKKLIMSVPEVKHHDISATYGQIDYANATISLATIVQGDDDNQRIGNIIRPKSLDFNLNAYLNLSSVSTNPAHVLRCIIFKWHEDNQLLNPTSAHILNTVAQPLITASQYNLQGKDQKLWSILYDRCFSISSTKGLCLDRNIKLQGTVQYGASGATTAHDCIYLLLVADDITGAHFPAIHAQWTARLNYIDN